MSFTSPRRLGLLVLLASSLLACAASAQTLTPPAEPAQAEAAPVAAGSCQESTPGSDAATERQNQRRLEALERLEDEAAASGKTHELEASFDAFYARRLRSEGRDEAWASQTERTLTEALGSGQYPGVKLESVTCGRTFCRAELSWEGERRGSPVMRGLKRLIHARSIEVKRLESSAFKGQGELLYFSRDGADLPSELEYVAELEAR